MKIVVFGGSGFVGRHLAAALSARGHQLRLPVRDRERAKSLILLPGADVVAFDPGAANTIIPHLEGADAAVNLCGILHETTRGEFVRVHSEFARVLCDGCAQKKVPRFVQVSALNAAASANSEYLRSKAKAEQIAQNAAPTRAVIIRPSVVFGAGDSLTSLFARLAKWTPILALPCAHAAMQPIAVEDLVALIAHCLETGEEDGKILLAGGPEEMTLGDIAARSIAAAGMRRKLIPLGPGLSLALAAVLEKIPGINLISCDNCRAAGYPSTARPNDALRILGELTRLEAGLIRMFGGGADGRTNLRR